MEEWRKIRYDVLHHDGVTNYSVSNLGRVRNDKTGRLLKIQTVISGHTNVRLRFKGEYFRKQIAHLVVQEFITKRARVVRIKHLDGDLSNCRVDNLKVSSYRTHDPYEPGQPYPPRYIARREE